MIMKLSIVNNTKKLNKIFMQKGAILKFVRKKLTFIESQF